jgi:hypothetical protein
MRKLRQAAWQALEALKAHATHHEHGCVYLDPAADALRAALAEPEQEPVAVVQDLDEVKRKRLVYELGFDWKDPLYASPLQRQPLSDGWILGMWPDTGFPHKVIRFARAIERAHGIGVDIRARDEQ